MSQLALLASGGDGAGVGAFFAIYLVFLVIMIVAMWKVFTKAGEEGWKAIIPIYNLIVLLKIVGRPIWFIILFLIPCVNIVAWIIVANDLSKSFGHGVGFTVGLVLLSPIFILILGFGDSTYVGPAGPEGAGALGTPPPPPQSPPSSPPPPPPPTA